MSKLLIFLVLTTIVSCSLIKTNKNYGHKINMKMSQEEQSRWYTKSDTLYCDSIAVATLQNVEWEYTEGNRIRMEISLSTINGYSDKSTDIFRYMYAKHPEAKLELNVDGYNK